MYHSRMLLSMNGLTQRDGKKARLVSASLILIPPRTLFSPLFLLNVVNISFCHWGLILWINARIAGMSQRFTHAVHVEWQECIDYVFVIHLKGQPTFCRFFSHTDVTQQTDIFWRTSWTAKSCNNRNTPKSTFSTNHVVQLYSLMMLFFDFASCKVLGVLWTFSGLRHHPVGSQTSSNNAAEDASHL